MEGGVCLPCKLLSQVVEGNKEVCEFLVCDFTKFKVEYKCIILIVFVWHTLNACMALELM